MQGVTAAVVAFIFVCLIFPSLIKNKNQYYVAFIATLLVILLDTFAHMFPETAASIKAVCYVLAGFAQIISIITLVLATGGLSARELGGDMIEVLRRGETQKEIIIPLSDEAKRKIQANQEAAERRVAKDKDEPKVYTIDNPPPSPSPAKPPSATTGPLPLD